VGHQAGGAHVCGDIFALQGVEHGVEELPDPERQQPPVGRFGVAEAGVERLPERDGDVGGGVLDALDVLVLMTRYRSGPAL
jgi:hypothetical protein